MPRRTSGRDSVHCFSAWHMREAFSVWCSRSMRPLSAGWWGVVLLRWMLHIFSRLWESCDSNWRPWSVMIVYGHPKRAIQPESRARDTVSAVMWIGKASGQRVKRSTAVRQYLNPADEVRGPTGSMWMCRKRAGGRLKLRTGVMVWREMAEVRLTLSEDCVVPCTWVTYMSYAHELLKPEIGTTLYQAWLIYP